MTQSSRPRVLTEQDAGAMDTLIRRGETAATVAEQKTTELQAAANDLNAVKATIPAAAKSAADLATAQAKTTLDTAAGNANSAAAAALASLATLPKFRSADQNNPPGPTQAELDANPNGIWGVKLNAAGVAQQLKWTPHTAAGAWQAVGAPPASAAQVQLVAALATAFDSTSTANPRNPTTDEIALYQATNGNTQIKGSKLNADGWRQPLVWQNGAWQGTALPQLDTNLLADIAHTTDEMRSVAGTYSIGRAPQAGDPAGTYRWVNANGDVLDTAWNGNAKTGETVALASYQQVAQMTAPTLAALRTYLPIAKHVVVLGHTTPGDWGPPRIARWVAGSADADDNGMRIRPAAGGGVWAFATDMQGFAHSRWYNLDPNGGTDLAPKINSILTRFDLLLNLHPDNDLNPGAGAVATYRIDSQVTVSRPRRLHGAYAFNRSVVIDASRITGGGVAVKIPTTNAPAAGTADHDMVTILKHVEIRGAGKNAQGAYQNAYGLQRSGCLYRCEHVLIAGFLVGEHVQANQTYITDMVDCVITTNGTNVKYDSVAAGVNSGEKLTYSGGYIGGGNVGLEVPDGWEITLRNVSLDYNQQQMALNGLSSITFVAGHIEWDSGTPLVLMGPQYMADVILRDVTFLKIMHVGSDQHAVFPIRREHLLDNEYVGLGGNRGSIQGTVHSGKNGTQQFAFTAKQLSNTLYQNANYLNDNSVGLLITWQLEFSPNNGTGAVFQAWTDRDSLDDGTGGIRANARAAADELVPHGTPAGTKRLIRQYVPAGAYFSWRKNDYVGVLNINVEATPHA